MLPMLEEWILKIRQNSRYYSPETWKFRISGNIIEFSVPKEFTIDKKIYRCSVITIGQILKALSCEIEKVGYHYLIQSYPNIESPHLIASIRMEEEPPKNHNPFPLITDYTQYNTEQKRLQVLSFNYQFSLTEAGEKVSKLLQNYFKVIHSSSWFILSSKHDNPFVWLKLGNLKETILKNCKNELSLKSPEIFDSCLNRVPHDLNLPSPENEIFQALLATKIS